MQVPNDRTVAVIGIVVQSNERMCDLVSSCQNTVLLPIAVPNAVPFYAAEVVQRETVVLLLQSTDTVW